jgi:hypothetical protein
VLVLRLYLPKHRWHLLLLRLSLPLSMSRHAMVVSGDFEATMAHPTTKEIVL